MSAFRYRLEGISNEDLDDLIESGLSATLSLLQRALWVEVTLTDDTRELDLDDFMGTAGYVPDTTGPTVRITAGPHAVGTEHTILVDATAGPITVDLPLVANRLGNDLLVMKVDSTANAVTIDRGGVDTIGGLATQILDAQGDSVLLVGNDDNSDWSIAGSTRSEDITFDPAASILVSTNVQDALEELATGSATTSHAPTHLSGGSDEVDGDRVDIDYTPTNYTPDTTPPEVTLAVELTAHLAGLDNALAPKSFVAGEALTAGDVLTLNTSGEVIRAESSISAGNWRVVGVSKATVLSGATVSVVTKHGECPPIRFGSIPGAATNGSTVWVSPTTGEATLSPPTTSGNTLYIVGTLQGADGATTTPAVMLTPQFIAHRR
jgi:hypothetical protein